jgi:UrcA family protein
MKMTNWIARIALCTAASLPISYSALAQAPEEITVTGRYGQVPDSVRTLSQAVSYADLDLSTPAGRDMLRHRVSLTSRFLCNRLGESDASSPIVASCRDAAYRDAMTRVETVEASFAPRGTTWARGPAWQAPYPADWYTQYPMAPAPYASTQPYSSTPVVQPVPASDPGYTSAAGERG